MHNFLLIALGASLLSPNVLKANTFREYKESCILASHYSGVKERLIYSAVQIERSCTCSANASLNVKELTFPDWCMQHQNIEIEKMNKVFKYRWD